jgi:HK97 family phage major capsid protein
MNLSQIQHRERALKTWAAELQTKVKLIESKGGKAADVKSIAPEFREWEDERDLLKRAREINAASPAWGTDAGNFGSAPDVENDFRSAIDNGKRLHFGQKMAQGLARSISNKTAIASNGAAVVTQELRPDPIALGKPPTGLLDVLPTIPHGTPQFSYLRQNLRTNTAAVVADGSQKPTSEFSVTRVNNGLSVIAHLSEAIQSYWLLDNGDLSGWLQQELQYGLSKAVESTTLTAINGTSGIQTQSYSTSIPVTLRKSMTKLEILGYVPKAIVLHPSDFESIELALSTTNAVEHLSLPYDPATRRLYGVPIATTVAQSVGTGHVIASGAVAIDTDSLGVQLRWSDQGADAAGNDMFSYNEQRARLEGRFATSVYLPAGVVVATLA